jgi:CheY-like chemotaxis protein
MPDTDGFTLAEQIQADERYKSIRLVMLTSSGNPEDVTRSRSLGIAGYITKPVKQSELFDVIVTTIGLPDAEKQPRKSASPKSQPRGGRALHVLLAEDNGVNQILATKIFEKLGHRVTVVDDGRAAVEAAKSTTFDLIAMDIQMPELDGLQACREIREWEQAAGGHVPIIAMTAHAMKGDRERCIEAGMDGYVAKPIHADELAAAIEEVCGSHPPADAVDRSSLLNNFDGDRELLRSLIKRFAADSPQQLARIRTAIDAHDAEELRLGAHSLKGSIGNFVASHGWAVAQRLEHAGKDADLSAAESLFAELEAEVARVIAEVNSLIDSGTPAPQKTAGGSAP